MKLYKTKLLRVRSYRKDDDVTFIFSVPHAGQSIYTKKIQDITPFESTILTLTDNLYYVKQDKLFS